MLKKSIGILSVMCVFGLTGCFEQKQQGPVVQMTPKVTVQSFDLASYESKFLFPGRIDAKSSVTIKTRIRGFLKERRFEEGDNVKKGEVLFVIEQDPFKAKLSQATATLAKAVADEKNAALEYNRALKLIENKNISQSTLDNREAAYLGARANVLQAKASLELAKLDLEYTTIVAPFSGKIGLSDYSIGEYLNENTSMATLVSNGPINVLFSVSENELLTLQKDGVLKPNAKVKVSLVMADGSVYNHLGKINFSDVVVDEHTDTVKLRAEFNNAESKLISGQFLSVQLEYVQPQQRVLIPQSAVMSDPTGKTVYVVDENNVVSNRQIKVGPTIGQDYVILDGLQPGEFIIVDGLQKTRPGQKVEPVQAEQVVGE
ncbi:MAG: efflux RND transporter periplasmic adaptor subunit [Alphaproteobacteria bacterium]|nr:efflux RND transporter periplasmic adaptor subunit [Alphaproteobacteria bacterium]